MKQTIYITYENRKCPVIISDEWEWKDKIDKKYNTVLIECLWFKQSILAEDLLWFLEDLPDLIKQKKEIEQELNASKNNLLQIRLSWEDKSKIEKLATKNGYKNISAYVRDKALQS